MTRSYARRGVRSKESRRRSRDSDARLSHLCDEAARRPGEGQGPISLAPCMCSRVTWIPAFAGMTIPTPGRMNPALPLLVHVEILPWMLPVRVLLVAANPGLNERVLDRVEAEPPRVVRGNDLRHVAIDLVALGPVGQPPRSAIQLVVFGMRKRRLVGLA